MSFEKWWEAVNAIVEDTIGVSADCMPDLVFVRDLYDDELSPRDCADNLFDKWVSEGDLPADVFELMGDYCE